MPVPLPARFLAIRHRSGPRARSSAARLCPLDAVPSVSRDVHEVAGLQFQRLFLACEDQLRGASQQNHPFMPILVEPVSRGRSVTM